MITTKNKSHVSKRVPNYYALPAILISTMQETDYRSVNWYAVVDTVTDN